MSRVIARVGQWCLRHGWWVRAAWAIAVAAGIVATGPLFDRLADGGLPRDVESVAANSVINAGNDSAGTVIGVIDHVDPSSTAVRENVTEVARRIANLEGVRSVEQPFGGSDHSGLLVSTDGRAVLVSVTLTGLDRNARNAAITA